MFIESLYVCRTKAQNTKLNGKRFELPQRKSKKSKYEPNTIPLAGKCPKIIEGGRKCFKK